LQNPSFFQPIWEDADALHFLGKDLLKRARKRGFDGTIQSFLIPPAIDTKYFTAVTRNYEDSVGTMERPLRILSAARLYWTKGYEYGLQAVRLLIDQGIYCEYHITGDGPYKEAVLFTVQDLGLQESVTLLNFQPQSKVKEQMEWADVFLHASISEGFSNVALEAQSMALPVVCTDSDGLPENIENGSTGFVVPRRNPEAIAEKLVLLCRNAALRRQMGEAGRVRVLTQFQLEDKIPEWERFFESVLNLQTRNQSVSDTQSQPILHRTS
jgi:colanic acid/amylovoran biosynthesis glycosyltransferase